MLKRDALASYLKEYLDPTTIADYGPTGMQVEGREEIRSLATAVSASWEAIEAAVAQGVDGLIVHHGLFWKNDPLEIVGAKKRKLALLLRHDISLFAYHLPLDAHQEVGNNWKAARDLGWKNLTPFGNCNGVPIGVKGVFEEKEVTTFVKELEAYYNHCAHAAQGGAPTVASAALVSGGAYRLLHEAAKEGVDCFITGNFDEPAWSIAHEEKIHFFALGHFATERVGVQALGLHLQKKYDIPCVFLDFDNPF